MADTSQLLTEIINEASGTKQAVERLDVTLAEILEVLKDIRKLLKEK
jgi:hypothetical protein